jgi:hypothetical protein
MPISFAGAFSQLNGMAACGMTTLARQNSPGIADATPPIARHRLRRIASVDDSRNVG